MFPDREVFRQQTVYFDFDRSAVKPGEKSKIEAVAAHLKNETANKVEIEGHCDERGTEEYNRALGERRALAVREYLVNLGIAADRISTVSFGEDKAAVEGHDEAAWAKNRRGEFVLLKPKP
ncbi:MAG: peptidoglycan-associated lipoprotein Pal [Chloroflexi bacterium]|nr:peptidoglycan-associated lipoprotein Pal [Chloroflexota bacterium]